MQYFKVKTVIFCFNRHFILKFRIGQAVRFALFLFTAYHLFWILWVCASPIPYPFGSFRLPDTGQFFGNYYILQTYHLSSSSESVKVPKRYE